MADYGDPPRWCVYRPQEGDRPHRWIRNCRIQHQDILQQPTCCWHASAALPQGELTRAVHRELSPESHALLDSLLDELRGEIYDAVATHGPMSSPHEGKAVIEEELDELWDEIKADRGKTGLARAEALQIAAMGLRYIIDVVRK